MPGNSEIAEPHSSNFHAIYLIGESSSDWEFHRETGTLKVTAHGCPIALTLLIIKS